MVDHPEQAPRSPRIASPGSAALGIAAGLAQAAAHASELLAPGVLLGAALLALAVDGAPLRRGARDGALFGAVVTIGFAPQAGAAWMIGVGACCFLVCGAALGATGALASRRGVWGPLLGLPLVAALLEGLNGFGPLGDYLGVAASVTGLPILAVARLGGAPLVAGAAVGLGVAFFGCLQSRRRAASAITLALWLSLVLGAAWPEPTPSIRVAAVVPHPAPTSRGGLEVAQELADLTLQAARAGAVLVVWPEASIHVVAAPLGPPFEALRQNTPARGRRGAKEPGAAGRETWEVIARAAHAAQLPLVAGVFVAELDQNLAVLVEADGRFSAVYSKNHLIPGMERYTPGQRPPEPWRVDALSRSIGALICFDDSFRRGSAALAARGAALLVVPTNDWPRVATRHRRLSQLRAAETGLPVVRAASGGISQIVDGRGRVVAWAPSGPRGVVLVADVPIGQPDAR